MPRISLWRENHSNDYKFFDNRVREVFTAGGVGIWIHKLLGPVTDSNNTGDATQPVYTNQSEQNIQDLLFLENRNRKYEPDIYKMRGHYTLNDNEFNLSQFGLFLNNDNLFITFHINDMIERIGRKLIPGDVLEMPNMKDYWPLDDQTPSSLKKFYVVNEILKAAEGYSPTWWPHLYRVKVIPMVDSQEFADILNQANTDSDGNETGGTLKDLMSPYLKNLAVDNAIVQQAENNLPTSGYDTEKFFVLPVDPETNESLQNEITADNINYTSDLTVSTPTQNIQGYLTGSSIAPNGFTVVSLTYFPEDPKVGEYCLRTDYLPNTLYRWDGLVWRIVNDVQRAALTGATNNTQLGTFVNNTNTSKITSGQTITQRQALSKILLPKSDF
jgi:hypothetical protein